MILSILEKKQENNEIINQETAHNNSNENAKNESKSKKKEKSKPKPQPQPSNTKKWKDILFQILPCLNPSGHSPLI